MKREQEGILTKENDDDDKGFKLSFTLLFFSALIYLLFYL